MWFRIFLTSIFFFILNGCDNQIQIIDKPIIFNQERINLTKEYFKQRYDLERDTILRTPKIIVLHWTCLLYTSPSPRDVEESRMPSSA